MHCKMNDLVEQSGIFCSNSPQCMYGCILVLILIPLHIISFMCACVLCVWDWCLCASLSGAVAKSVAACTGSLFNPRRCVSLAVNLDHLLVNLGVLLKKQVALAEALDTWEGCLLPSWTKMRTVVEHYVVVKIDGLSGKMWTHCYSGCDVCALCSLCLSVRLWQVRESPSLGI